jgi:hypothetical protein
MTKNKPKLNKESMTKKQKKIKQFKPLKMLQVAVRQAEKEWQEDIDNTKNPVLRQIKQDYKDLVEIEHKLEYFYLMYGIDVKLYVPKNMPKMKGIIKKLFNYDQKTKNK